MRTLHVGLRVADLERSIAFYTSIGYEVLGDGARHRARHLDDAEASRRRVRGR